MLRGSVGSGAEERLTFTVRLSEVGDSGRVKMPVAITGSWVHPANGNKVVITRADLGTVVRNFHAKSNGEINVDYDHASEMPNLLGQPRPSAGRVLALMGPEPYFDSRRVQREILWGSYEPTEMARTMIRKREYRYISPVLQRERVNKTTGLDQGVTITTIALTNTPVLEEMPEIFASEEGQVLRCAETAFPSRSRVRRFSASRNANDDLTELALELAEREHISYEAAYRRVGHENPELASRAKQAVARDVPTQRLSATASDELARQATARAKQEGIEYQTALSEVSSENPELARRYRKEIGRIDD
ncbi:MAG: phage protease [Terriglobia bacterium]